MAFCKYTGRKCNYRSINNYNICCCDCRSVQLSCSGCKVDIPDLQMEDRMNDIDTRYRRMQEQSTQSRSNLKRAMFISGSILILLLDIWFVSIFSYTDDTCWSIKDDYKSVIPLLTTILGALISGVYLTVKGEYFNIKKIEFISEIFKIISLFLILNVSEFRPNNTMQNHNCPTLLILFYSCCMIITILRSIIFVAQLATEIFI